MSDDLLDAIRAAFPREVRKDDVEFFRDYAEEKPKENTDRGKYRKLFAAHRQRLHGGWREGPAGAAPARPPRRRVPDGRLVRNPQGEGRPLLPFLLI